MIKEFKVGDVLSESSHYKIESIDGTQVKLRHQESGEYVYIQKSYITSFLNSADEILEEVKVTKEDKKDGALGIRSIWENIHSSQVFTVCFKKQDVPKSKKRLQEEINTIIEQFSNSIDSIKNSKKGVANAAKNLVTELIENPILPYEEGEDRVLRGYKIQFESRDGKYKCIDMDIDEENNVRLVNINTIKWLIINGIKYIVG